ncbi:MAG: hypothetical protein ACKORB_05775 [Opitutia bacterium]
MPEPENDIESALAALKPRAPGPEVARAVARALDPAAESRGGVLLWFSGLAAAACLALVFLVLPEEEAQLAPFAVTSESSIRTGNSVAADKVFADAAPAARSAPPAASAGGVGLGAAAPAKAMASVAPEAQYRLAGATRSPARLELLEPMRLRDGTYVRPVRLRRELATHWEDAGSGARLVRYRPEESTLLLPLETY